MRGIVSFAMMSAVRELRLWPMTRWITAGAAWLVLLVALVGTTRVLAPPLNTGLGTTDASWGLPMIGVAALLAALTVASYVRPTPGAEATMCDLRWPVFGLGATVLAVGSPTTGPFPGFLDGPEGSVAHFARLALAMAALGILLWGLIDRLRQERAARQATELDDKAGIACTTCRPIFPAARHARARDIATGPNTTGHRHE